MDITVEGMRLGERLDVFVARRREPCWVEVLEVVGLDAAGLPSGRELTEVLSAVLVC